MEQNEIEKGNRLIAEFMQIPKCDRCIDCGRYKFGTASYFYPYQMSYHKSWTTFMPVVEKIEGLGYAFNITYTTVSVMLSPYQRITIQVAETKLQATYTAVIQFITYHNTLKPHTVEDDK